MNPPKNLFTSLLNFSVHIQWNYNIINDTVHFNVYCTTMKQQQQSTRYSKTVLYNVNNIVNISITGLFPNTTYTCCVLAVTSYGESGPICQNITTTNVISKCTVYNYVIYVAQNEII